MKDYTYQDMLRMQEDAAIRVREMKKRASIIAEEAHDVPEAANESSSLVKMLLSDTESLLIVAVLALLTSENADNLTELALLYILL